MTDQRPDRPPASPRLRVSLFVTCLADLLRPSVAFASIQLLEQAGCEVTVPTQQTCCGQPAFNSGEYQASVPLAQQVIDTFEDCDYVVVPSGSCAAMICSHYPTLLDGEWRERALQLAARTFELTTFLVDVLKLQPGTISTPALPAVTYHDSCAGLRELGIKEQPRKLLREVCQTEVQEMQQTEVCCGFGGTFCAKMPEISGKMVQDKLDNALSTEAGILAGGDLGCLFNIAGRAKRQGVQLEVRHVAELLAGDRTGPGIGEGDN